MGWFSVETIAMAGDPVTENLGIPKIFTDIIEQEWAYPNGSVIIGVTLSDRTEQDWRRLGEILTQSLVDVSSTIGLSCDGNLPEEIQREWLSSIHSANAPTLIDYDYSLMKHWNQSVRSLVMNSSLRCFQQNSGDSWVASVWSSANSNWFNYGCDLMLAFFAHDLVAEFGPDRRLDDTIFNHALGRAHSWLIPLDSNIGYVVGLPVQSTTYKDLEQSIQRV